jgi:5-epi-alpha-selinene synthase
MQSYSNADSLSPPGGGGRSLQPITFPAFLNPFTSSIHPSLELVDEGSLRWARDTGLSEEGTELYRRIERHSFASLVCYTQPNTVRLDDLQLAADWMTWACVHDDRVDQDPGRFSRSELQVLHEQFFAVLEGRKAGEQESPSTRALRNLCERTSSRSTPGWLRRLFFHLKEYFQSNLWELDLHEQRIIPNLATYALMRPITGSVHVALTIINLTNDVPEDAAFLDHLIMRQMATLVGLQTNYYNDTRFFEKDLGGGQANLISVIQHEEGVSVQEAVNLAVELTNQQLSAFVHLKERLPHFGAEEVQARLYVTAMENWIAGYPMWATQGQRFAAWAM